MTNKEKIIKTLDLQGITSENQNNTENSPLVAMPTVEPYNNNSNIYT